MVAPLSEEEKEKIRELYEETQSIEKVAEELDRSKSTVQKYTQDMRDDDATDFVASDQSSDFSQMGYGEFIKHFFEQFGIGTVKDDFVEMVANMAEARAEIPDEDQMKHMLQNHASGVGNANDAAMIAETYWKVGERFLRAKGMSQQPQAQPGQWQRPVANQAPQPGMTGGGQWRSGASQQQGFNQQPMAQQQSQPPAQQSGNMGAIAQILQQQQQMLETMMQSQSGGDDGRDRLAEEIAELKEELKSSNGNDESTSMVDELQELQEAKDTLEAIMGNDDDGDDEMGQHFMALQQELRALREEVDQGSNVEMSDFEALGDSNMAILGMMAQRDDVDPAQLASIADNLGEVESDPEVAEKKLERDIKRMEHEMQQEKWDNILGRLEDTAGQLLEPLLGELDSQNGQELPEQPRHAAQAEQRPRQQQPSEQQQDRQVQQQRSPARQMVEESSEPQNEEPEPEVHEAEGEVVEAEVVGSDAEEESEDESDGSDPEPDDPELMECPVEGCDATFDSEMGLRGHMNGHTEEEREQAYAAVAEDDNE